MALSRQLGVSYDTAWSMKQKLIQAIRKCDQGKRQNRRTGMDDVCLPSKKVGIRSRGSSTEVPFIAVVETTDNNLPQEIQLHAVPGFRYGITAAYACNNLAPGSTTRPDGLAWFVAVKQARYPHISLVTGGSSNSVQSPVFKWVNTVLENLKNGLRRTLLSVPGILPAILRSSNITSTGFDLPVTIKRLALAAARTPPLLLGS